MTSGSNAVLLLVYIVGLPGIAFLVLLGGAIVSPRVQRLYDWAIRKGWSGRAA